jgi:hypothetical protein
MQLHAYKLPYSASEVRCPHCDIQQRIPAPQTLAPGYNALVEKCGWKECRRPFVVVLRMRVRPKPSVTYIGSAQVQGISARPSLALEAALCAFPMLTRDDIRFMVTVYRLGLSDWTEPEASSEAA